MCESDRRRSVVDKDAAGKFDESGEESIQTTPGGEVTRGKAVGKNGTEENVTGNETMDETTSNETDRKQRKSSLRQRLGERKELSILRMPFLADNNRRIGT